MPIYKTLAMICCILMLNGCMLTKVVTVPMRAGGAALTVVPVVGEAADEVIDTAADAVDTIPL